MPTEDGKMTITEVRENARTLYESLGSRQDEDSVWQRAATVLIGQMAGRLEEMSNQLVTDAENLKTAVAAGIKRLTEATTPAPGPTSAPADAANPEALAAAEVAALPAEMRPKGKASKPKVEVAPVVPPSAPPSNGDPAAIAAQIAGAGAVPPAPVISSTVKG